MKNNLIMKSRKRWLQNPRVEKENDIYTAYCDGLQIIGIGETKEDAIGDLEKCIEFAFRVMGIQQAKGLK